MRANFGKFLLKGIHGIVQNKVTEVVVWRIKKRAGQWSSNPPDFLNPAHLAKHCVKWVSRHYPLFKMIGIVVRSPNNLSIWKERRERISDIVWPSDKYCGWSILTPLVLYMRKHIYIYLNNNDPHVNWVKERAICYLVCRKYSGPPQDFLLLTFCIRYTQRELGGLSKHQ